MLKYLFKRKKKEWKDIEYFNPEWKDRIQLMSQFISEGEAVLDLGCGQMWLKEYLPNNCNYLGVDYISRDTDTIICNFNSFEFPSATADTAFISGCLEYITPFKWFLKEVTDNCNKVILSYCIIENFKDMKQRRERIWVNDLSYNDIITIFKKNNFKLVEELKTLNHIFVFENESSSH